MRPIDADLLFEHKVNGVIGNLSGDFVPGFIIDRTPTLDAVAVVRCKDCDHADHHVVGLGENFVYCNMWGTVSYGDGYCHHSARNVAEDES